jgi:hypothetical protein
MKIIAIDIESTKIIPFVIEVSSDGSITSVDTGVKSIGINDDHNNQELRNFTKEVYSFFDSVDLTKLAIIKRQTKGKFSASSVSFKLEALIQCYEKCEVEFVAKTTLNAFYKKNEFTIKPTHKYQTDAARLAQYLV